MKEQGHEEARHACCSPKSRAQGVPAYMRKIKPSDYDTVKALHEALFPVRYSDVRFVDEHTQLSVVLCIGRTDAQRASIKLCYVHAF
jgi:hypothetical protein